MFETKTHRFVLGIGTRGKISYHNQFFYTLLSLLKYLIAGDGSLTINRLKKLGVGVSV
jgi:hypothetical protein